MQRAIREIKTSRLYSMVYWEVMPYNVLFVTGMRRQWNRKGCISLSCSNFTEMPNLWITTIQQTFKKYFSYYTVHALSISHLLNSMIICSNMTQEFHSNVSRNVSTAPQHQIRLNMFSMPYGSIITFKNKCHRTNKLRINNRSCHAPLPVIVCCPHFTLADRCNASSKHTDLTNILLAVAIRTCLNELFLRRRQRIWN
jgi:hypothetical protein